MLIVKKNKNQWLVEAYYNSVSASQKNIWLLFSTISHSFSFLSFSSLYVILFPFELIWKVNFAACYVLIRTITHRISTELHNTGSNIGGGRSTGNTWPDFSSNSSEASVQMCVTTANTEQLRSLSSCALLFVSKITGTTLESRWRD